ncbi:phage antirepressor KilAC domain-containing protein [Streptomyces actuosus]|uniref:Phage antirepressor KilAC domain-containing protein n=1 Tax=Streptomyces actuosus TaxID=1885 RepID=A0ABS2VJ28_STRAS|nr:BRO family protein [Streptomyces actuosus]MBN0043094.1 phage antirepressor KilAC domain-containing protein [Streptomyces actuosus]
MRAYDLETGSFGRPVLPHLFHYPQTGQPVRSVPIKGEPWWVALDVAAVLELGNVHSSLALLDDDEKGFHSVETPGGPQQLAVVNEPGLYSLILRSRKPQAKTFKRWITHEVLPSIRKTGSYSVAVPQTLPEALRAFAAEVEAREAAEARVAELAPAAGAWETLAAAEGDYSVREAAQLLVRAGISTGQNRLFATLRDIGWIDASGQPYQAQVDAGRLRRRTTSYSHPHHGEPVLSSQVRITVKGVAALRGRLSGRQEALPLDEDPS